MTSFSFHSRVWCRWPDCRSRWRQIVYCGFSCYCHSCFLPKGSLSESFMELEGIVTLLLWIATSLGADVLQLHVWQSVPNRWWEFLSTCPPFSGLQVKPLTVRTEGLEFSKYTFLGVGCNAITHLGRSSRTNAAKFFTEDAGMSWQTRQTGVYMSYGNDGAT